MRFLNVFLISSLFIASAFAADPKIQVAKSAAQISASLKPLADSALVNGTYKDDEQKTRSDKVYYGADFTFDTNLKRSDVDFILNPANGRLPQLFNDRVSIRRAGNAFAMDTTVKVVKTMQVNGTLNYSVSEASGRSNHVFSSHSYNMFLFGNRIRVSVSDLANGLTRVSVLQLAAVKGSSQEKLDGLVIGNSMFMGKIRANTRKFKSGLGAIN